MPSIRPVAGIRMGLVLAAALGLFVRFTVRDRYPWIDVAYYALQLPVIAYAMLAAGTLSSRLGQRGQATACFVLAFSLVLLWVGTGTTWNRCKATRPDFRALEWNICRGRAGWEGIVAAIRSEKADVIGLVEANVSERGAEKFWLERFPGYSVSSPGRGLVLLVRGKIEKTHLQEFGVRSKLAVAQTKVAGRSLRIVLVDLEADPLSHRKLLMERVVAAAAPSASLPTLVLGDFNTPGDSIWFEKMRRSYSDAFERAGTGWLASWPFPLPVLALDHLWVSRGLQALCAGRRASWRSDHVRVWADLSFSREVSTQDGIGEYPRPSWRNPLEARRGKEGTASLEKRQMPLAPLHPEDVESRSGGGGTLAMPERPPSPLRVRRNPNPFLL